MFSTFFLLEMCGFCIKATCEIHPFTIPLSKAHFKNKFSPYVYYYTAHSYLKSLGQWFGKCGLYTSSTNIYGNLSEMQYISSPILDELNENSEGRRSNPPPRDPNAHGVLRTTALGLLLSYHRRDLEKDMNLPKGHTSC